MNIGKRRDLKENLLGATFCALLLASCHVETDTNMCSHSLLFKNRLHNLPRTVNILHIPKKIFKRNHQKKS